MVLLAAFALASTQGSRLPIVAEGQLVHPTHLLVKVADREYLTDLQQKGLQLVRYMPQIGWAVMDVGRMQLQKTRTDAKRIAGVLACEYDRAALPSYTPNDPLWSNQWHSRTLHLDTAWDLSLGSSSATVAIMDTGVERSHPDLAPNLWVNSREIPGNGIDDDGNGYVDDVNGYDFVANDPAPDDEQGHGTSCAGLAAGVGDNGIGVCGAAPRARIMVVRSGNSDGYFYDSANVPGYLYAADNGTRVLSMSFYSDRVSAAERDAIDYCVTKGCLPVAAAGNDSQVIPYYPAAYENTLSVAALNTDNTKAGFSDWGSWVDVSAPGVSLTTTTRGGGYTNGFAGTSGACPQVAGVAALLFGAKPSATVAEVRNAIEDSATLQNQAPYGEFSNYGLVDARKAMEAILLTPAAPKPSVVRYVTPIGTTPSVSTPVLAEAYGRGFQNGRFDVRTDNGRVRIVTSRRDALDFYLGPTTATLAIKRNDRSLATVRSPEPSGLVWPLIECSAPGASVSGGFFEALLPNDRAAVVVTPRSDSSFQLQATLRRVGLSGPAHLVLRRAFEGTTGATETVELYDWSSASYPYGSWITIASGPAPTAQATQTFAVPDIAKAIDYEGTVYLRIRTTGGTVPSSSRLRVDCAYLKK